MIWGLNCKRLTFTHLKIIKGGYHFGTPSLVNPPITTAYDTTRNLKISSQNEAA